MLKSSGSISSFFKLRSHDHWTSISYYSDLWNIMLRCRLMFQVCRDINRIKVCMETGRTVILLNLESLYESLYDALNQV